MKNITKVGLSALAGALAITSVNAGEMSMSGSMEASYTKGSGYKTTGNPLGMDKELSVTGSGELDNGTTVSYKQTITDAMAFNDSEIVFGGVLGMADVALTSTGSPISAIDDVTPTAFEEANALLGSIDDVNGMDGTYGIRVTMADFMGSGFKIDGMYTTDVGSGDAQADNGVTIGLVLNAGAYTTTGVQGTANDNSASSTGGGGAFLIVTSVSGTSPTGDIKIQHSADNVTYADLITFTQATGATSEIKKIDEGTTINRYVRVHNTIGGSSTPTINAIVGFGRNN